jgi:hypothetical protein
LIELVETIRRRISGLDRLDQDPVAVVWTDSIR